KSTLFAVAVDGAYARFAGRGYGHGVGLDQWGAKAMAEQGYTALQILGWRRSLRDDHSGVISAGMHTAGASATPGKGLYVSSAPGMIDS
ncbi:MAG: hypothetical protein HY725_13165, partial [Candidatus Rokubacteria bacterium]|nr:hypothetical protein [Candidatus Rokubacteria bacterium]